MGLFDIFKDVIGIDPGSQHLRIIRNGEIVFNELSQISLNTSTQSLTGLGNGIGLTGDDVILKPVDFAIADFIGFETLLRGAIKKGIHSNSIIPKSYKMFYSIPVSTTEIEKRAYRDSAEHAGATEVYMVVQSCCSAVGLNILFEKKYFILVDFGYSKIEMTVFVNSIPVSIGLVRMGTSKIYSLLKNHLKRKYELIVTDKEIDFILTELKKGNADICIRNITITVSETEELLNHFFVLVNDAFLEAMERLSGHKDIEKVTSGGLYFTGGGSAIDFLREKITIDSRLKRSVSQQPLLDNINGLMKIMSDRERFKEYITL